MVKTATEFSRTNHVIMVPSHNRLHVLLPIKFIECNKVAENALNHELEGYRLTFYLDPQEENPVSSEKQAKEKKVRPKHPEKIKTPKTLDETREEEETTSEVFERHDAASPPQPSQKPAQEKTEVRERSPKHEPKYRSERAAPEQHAAFMERFNAITPELIEKRIEALG